MNQQQRTALYHRLSGAFTAAAQGHPAGVPAEDFEQEMWLALFKAPPSDDQPPHQVATWAAEQARVQVLKLQQPAGAFDAPIITKQGSIPVEDILQEFEAIAAERWDDPNAETVEGLQGLIERGEWDSLYEAAKAVREKMVTELAELRRFEAFLWRRAMEAGQL